jgi:hypothetical protein
VSDSVQSFSARSRGAHAFWLVEPGRGEIRPATVATPGEDDVLIRTLWTGISRGTESLVFGGRVPASQYETMAAPFQEGALPGPVKYGYLNVGVVVEASWYGDAAVDLPLGEAFHSNRLTVRSSQVGAVAAARRASRTHRDRLAIALDLLTDPAYDILLTGTSSFDDLPTTMAALASGAFDGLCHTIDYSTSTTEESA